MASKRPADEPSGSPAQQRGKRARAEPPVKVIIDTDPGVDDALAILLALSPLAASGAVALSDGRLVPVRRLDVLGLTVVHGNLGRAGYAQLVGNACRVLGVAGRGDIPVYVGADRPIVAAAHGGAPHVHGADGMGSHVPPDGEAEDAAAVPSPVPREKESAASFIARACREHPGEVTLLTLGPLTNVAAALAVEPRLPELVAGVVSMAGAVAHPGNVTELAEANVWNDPEAAHAVFTSFAGGVVMVPLNVTHEFRLANSVLDRLREKGGAVGRFVHGVTQHYLAFYRSVCGSDEMSVHDPTAVLRVMCPSLFTRSRHSAVDVVTGFGPTKGLCVGDLRVSTENADASRKLNVEIMLGIDAAAATEVIEALLGGY